MRRRERNTPTFSPQHWRQVADVEMLLWCINSQRDKSSSPRLWVMRKRNDPVHWRSGGETALIIYPGPQHHPDNSDPSCGADTLLANQRAAWQSFPPPPSSLYPQLI
ncbi:hypothetical protein DPEC_G00242550 [Dallia pectoralis]|uniref:Uncharacterized protein n=1 Tax=Dallia pectoralis TaxID=75939 RepID=A0ACC2FV54_DALPE|nr:hypothetical protein DPEC_G00242550 [Dallia pectoralis]